MLVVTTPFFGGGGADTLTGGLGVDTLTEKAVVLVRMISTSLLVVQTTHRYRG